MDSLKFQPGPAHALRPFQEPAAVFYPTPSAHAIIHPRLLLPFGADPAALHLMYAYFPSSNIMPCDLGTSGAHGVFQKGRI
jgi:hypothetical protein